MGDCAVFHLRVRMGGSGPLSLRQRLLNHRSALGFRQRGRLRFHLSNDPVPKHCGLRLVVDPGQRLVAIGGERGRQLRRNLRLHHQRNLLLAWREVILENCKGTREHLCIFGCTRRASNNRAPVCRLALQIADHTGFAPFAAWPIVRLSRPSHRHDRCCR